MCYTFRDIILRTLWRWKSNSVFGLLRNPPKNSIQNMWFYRIIFDFFWYFRYFFKNSKKITRKWDRKQNFKKNENLPQPTGATSQHTYNHLVIFCYVYVESLYSKQYRTAPFSFEIGVLCNKSSQTLGCKLKGIMSIMLGRIKGCNLAQGFSVSDPFKFEIEKSEFYRNFKIKPRSYGYWTPKLASHMDHTRRTSSTLGTP